MARDRSRAGRQSQPAQDALARVCFHGRAATSGVGAEQPGFAGSGQQNNCQGRRSLILNLPCIKGATLLNQLH